MHKRRAVRAVAVVAVVLAGVMLAAVGGCSMERPAVAPEAVAVQAGDEALWQACRAEVVGRGFGLDVEDRRAGLIRSEPLTSCQWFEVGCQDVVTGVDLLESSVQTVRRIIVVEIAPAGVERFSVACRVEVEQLVVEEEVATGKVRARDILGRSAGRLPGTRGEAESWAPVGRDHALEAAVLEGIEGRLAERAG